MTTMTTILALVATQGLNDVMSHYPRQANQPSHPLLTPHSSAYYIGTPTTTTLGPLCSSLNPLSQRKRRFINACIDPLFPVVIFVNVKEKEDQSTRKPFERPEERTRRKAKYREPSQAKPRTAKHRTATRNEKTETRTKPNHPKNQKNQDAAIR